MRALSAALAIALSFATFACGRSNPPLGRWEGTYETADTMIVARLEIDANGAIYVSAPDALEIRATDEGDREVIRQRLAIGLDRAWGDDTPRQFDFDGTVFRKPGGIAPQMEWDPGKKQMTLIVYPGTQPTVRVPLHAVGNFSVDPWPG
jgi:hypothetical protein